VVGRPPERWRSIPWRPPFSGYPPPTGASHSRPTTNPTTSKAHEAVIDKDNLRTAPRSTSIWGSTTFIMRAVLTHLSIPLRPSTNISLRNDQEQIVFSTTNSSAATSPAPVILPVLDKIQVTNSGPSYAHDNNQVPDKASPAMPHDHIGPRDSVRPAPQRRPAPTQQDAASPPHVDSAIRTRSRHAPHRQPAQQQQEITRPEHVAGPLYVDVSRVPEELRTVKEKIRTGTSRATLQLRTVDDNLRTNTLHSMESSALQDEHIDTKVFCSLSGLSDSTSNIDTISDPTFTLPHQHHHQQPPTTTFIMPSNVQGARKTTSDAARLRRERTRQKQAATTAAMFPAAPFHKSASLTSGTKVLPPAGSGETPPTGKFNFNIHAKAFMGTMLSTGSVKRGHNDRDKTASGKKKANPPPPSSAGTPNLGPDDRGPKDDNGISTPGDGAMGDGGKTDTINTNTPGDDAKAVGGQGGLPSGRDSASKPNASTIGQEAAKRAGDGATADGRQGGLPRGRDSARGPNISINGNEATVKACDHQGSKGNADGGGVGGTNEGHEPPSSSLGNEHARRPTEPNKDGLGFDAVDQPPFSTTSTKSSPIVIDDVTDPEPATPLTQASGSGGTPTSMGSAEADQPFPPRSDRDSSPARTDSEDGEDVDYHSSHVDVDNESDDEENDDMDLNSILARNVHGAGNANRPGRLLSPSEAKKVAKQQSDAVPEEVDVYSKEELPEGCMRVDFVLSCKSSKLPAKLFDEDGVNTLLCAILHTAFPNFLVSIIDIHRVGSVSISDRNVATATIRAVLESPKGLEFEEALRDYVRHQAWKQESTYTAIGMEMPVHAPHIKILFPGCTTNNKAASFMVIGATPTIFGPSVEDCRGINKAAYEHYNPTMPVAHRCRSFREWEALTTLMTITMREETRGA
jgi:hypothetical protein